jgi:malonyl-CoA O-methyltransferase
VPDSGIDARAARRRFDRAARTYSNAARLESEVGARMLKRLDYIRLEPARVLDAGSGPPQRVLGRRYRGAEVITLDFSLGMLRVGSSWLDFFRRRKSICADIAHLPVASGAIDLVWSNMALHWTADPLAALREFHRVLAVGGLTMFSTLGPDTLAELRAAAGEARVHRFADMHDLGDMLLAAGFADPVMDMERLTLLYADGAALLADLRASGQTHAARERARGLSGARFRATLEERLSAQRRGEHGGKLAVSFEVVYGHAWKAAPKRAADGRSVVQFY